LKIIGMRIIIVSDNASSRFGGEAFLPLNYFRLLRLRNIDVRLVVHERNKTELQERFPADLDRLYFAEDTALHKALFSWSRFLPRRLAEATTGFIIHLSTQLAQRRIVRDLVKKYKIDVVHVPIPVSPKIPSLIYGVGAYVVIGPLNGGMEYPEAFRQQQGLLSRLSIAFGRWLANFMNILFPGKRRASIVLVANRRTREALPHGMRGRVIELVENGVDFSVWHRSALRNENQPAIRFIFVGRLVDWKALDIVLEAMHRLKDLGHLYLEIIGDGPMLESWQNIADRLALGPTVQFSGWMSQQECAQRLQLADVFVLPSLFECGGAVVLEAMAMGLPVIATAWGGPTDYLDESCGILVRPCSRESLVTGFAGAMKTLAESSALRKRLGEAGRTRAMTHFDWDRKIDKILSLYELACNPETAVPNHRGRLAAADPADDTRG
jgi:glycosyltransferase involved in cell wall biosynthesis